jgi:tRNA A-37 threonylcarbamoyl transferase component Bud32
MTPPVPPVATDLTGSTLLRPIDLTQSMRTSGGGVVPVGYSLSARSPRGPADDHMEELRENLLKVERELAKKSKDLHNTREALLKAEQHVESGKHIIDSLRVQLERTERDLDRANRLSETRAQASDREIALLKTSIVRFKALRECVAGELSRCKDQPLHSLNACVAAVALDRVLVRVDAAFTGDNWRSQRSDFKDVLFTEDDLEQAILQFPVPIVAKPATGQASDASAPTGTEPAALVALQVPPVTVPPRPETPRIEPTAEPEADKICNLEPGFEIDYWSLLPGFGDMIGEGGYAEVYKCTWQEHPAAVKKFKVDFEAIENGDPPMDTDLIRREILILSKLDHPNVMKFYGASVTLPNICIVCELLEKGSFDDLLHTSKKPMGMKLRMKICLDAARGLHYLHSRAPVVIHRDIKSGNVLLDGQWNAKLSDFGLAKLKYRPFDMPAPKGSSVPLNWSVILNSGPVGTAAWAAPEILEHAPYNEFADIYSFGVMIWEAYERKSPYPGKEGPEIVQMTLDGKRLELSPETPADLCQLIRDCWLYDPWARPTAELMAKRLQAHVESLPEDPRISEDTGSARTTPRSSQAD